MLKLYLVVFMLAAGIRTFLFMQGYDEVLQRRIEVTTPANSFRGVLEGVDLMNNNINPYDGDNCHILIHHVFLIRAIFVIFDLLTAYLLGAVAKQSIVYLSDYYARALAKGKEHARELKDFKQSSDEALQFAFERTLPKRGLGDSVQTAVTLCYVLNPFAIASCVALSTTTLDNTLIVMGLYCVAVIGGNIGLSLSLICIALAAANSIHLSALVLAMAGWYYAVGQLEKTDKKHKPDLNTWSTIAKCYLISFMFFGVVLGSFLYGLYLLYGSEQFLVATYGFVLSVPNLQPNLGLFWYFFIEVFDHFRLFFTWVFQVNILVYLVPMAVTMRSDPCLLYFSLLILISVFKPYPSVADTAVYLSLLPAMQHLFQFLPHTLTTGCAFVVSLILCPVMWAMWIDVGSANANFFFAVTLFYNTAQIFLLTDVLFAHNSVATACAYGVRPVISRKDPQDKTKSVVTQYKIMFSNQLFSWLIKK